MRVAALYDIHVLVPPSEEAMVERLSKAEL